MTRRRSLLFSLALLMGAAFALPGQALARKGDRGAKLNLRMLERAADRLGLDDATLKQIEDRVYEAEKRGIELKSQLELAKLELRRVLDQDAPDKAAAMKRIEDVGRLETALRKHQMGLMIDVKTMLTPDQRKMLRTLTRRGERGKRRGHRGRRGGPDGPDGRGGPGGDGPPGEAPF